MPALVSPAAVRREEFGAIRGRVESLSSFPVSFEGMVAVLQNRELAQSFFSDGPPYAGRIALIPDPTTASGPLPGPRPRQRVRRWLPARSPRSRSRPGAKPRSRWPSRRSRSGWGCDESGPRQQRSTGRGRRDAAPRRDAEGQSASPARRPPGGAHRAANGEDRVRRCLSGNGPRPLRQVDAARGAAGALRRIARRHQGAQHHTGGEGAGHGHPGACGPNSGASPSSASR